MKKIILSLLTICLSTFASVEATIYECQSLDASCQSMATSINEEGVVAGHYYNVESKRKAPFVWSEEKGFTPLTDLKMAQREKDAPLFIDATRLVIPTQTETPYVDKYIVRRFTKKIIVPSIYSLADGSSDEISPYSEEEKPGRVSILSVDKHGNFLIKASNTKSPYMAYIGTEYKIVPKISGWMPVSISEDTIGGTRTLDGKSQALVYSFSKNRSSISRSERSFELKTHFNNLLLGKNLAVRDLSEEGLLIDNTQKERVDASMGLFNPIAMNHSKTAIGTTVVDDEVIPAIFLDGKMRPIREIVELADNFEKIVELKAINEAGVIVGSALREGVTYAIVLSPKEESQVVTSQSRPPTFEEKKSIIDENNDSEDSNEDPDDNDLDL